MSKGNWKGPHFCAACGWKRRTQTVLLWFYDPGAA